MKKKFIIVTTFLLALFLLFPFNSASAYDCANCDTNGDGCFTSSEDLDSRDPLYHVCKNDHPECHCITQSSDTLGCGGGLGPIAEFLCNTFKFGDPQAQREGVGQKLNYTLSTIIGFLTSIAAFWFMIQVILGGYAWISAGGDKGKLEEAQKKILNSIIGLLIVIAAWIIVAVLGVVLGIEILNPGKVIQTLGL